MKPVVKHPVSPRQGNPNQSQWTCITPLINDLSMNLWALRKTFSFSLSGISAGSAAELQVSVRGSTRRLRLLPNSDPTWSGSGRKSQKRGRPEWRYPIFLSLTITDIFKYFTPRMILKDNNSCVASWTIAWLAIFFRQDFGRFPLYSCYGTFRRFKHRTPI